MKNYTSNVPIERTIARIEQILAKAGASNIFKNYENGELKSLSFTIVSTEKTFMIMLPANVNHVYLAMKQNVKRPHQGTLKKIKDQSARTAWKLMQDWIEVQISLIEMHQAELLQVFLPYIYNGKTSLFEAFKNNQLSLPSHEE